MHISNIFPSLCFNKISWFLFVNNLIKTTFSFSIILNLCCKSCEGVGLVLWCITLILRVWYRRPMWAVIWVVYFITLFEVVQGDPIYCITIFCGFLIQTLSFLMLPTLSCSNQFFIFTVIFQEQHYSPQIFSLTIILTNICVCVWFHMNWRIVFSNSVKNIINIFDRD